MFTMTRLLVMTTVVMMLVADTESTGGYTNVFTFQDSNDLPLNVSLDQGKTDVDSIYVEWYAVPYHNNSHVLNYQLHYDPGNRLLQTGNLAPDKNKFFINGLQTSTRYNVCLTIRYREGDQDYESQLCKVMTTIPVIRQESVYALCFTLTSVALLVITASLYWRYRKFVIDRKKAKLVAADNGGESEDDDALPRNHVNSKSLSQRLNRRYSGYEQAQAASSIEDRETFT